MAGGVAGVRIHPASTCLVAHTRLERAGIRGRRGICRSLTELSAKSRRLGDGYYYLLSSAWPPDTVSVNLTRAWAPLA